MALMSPALLMCLDPDVNRTGPEPYVEFARERKMSMMIGVDTVLLQEGPRREYRRTLPPLRYGRESG